MIGNPVSMPRVIRLVENYNELAGKKRVFFVEVREQDIMDWELIANRNGHIACTHGGESLAGIVSALEKGIVDETETAVVDSTAHALKFAGFQEMYFENRFPDEYEVTPKGDMINRPTLVRPDELEKFPAPGKPLTGDDLQRFINKTSEKIARTLDLQRQ
jgi:threonine synthase